MHSAAHLTRTLIPALLLSTLLACGGGGSSSSSSSGSGVSTPVINQQPEAFTTEAGTVAVFSIKADSATPLTYQWLRQGVAIPGATSSSYAFLASDNDHGVDLSVRVSNAQGSVVSTAARLQVSKQSGIMLLAGQPGQSGMTDGNAAKALFAEPAGLARDASGNLFISDSGNKVIRKISVDGTVSTFAGKAGESGSADGFGPAARFSKPSSITIDTAGNLYVLDYLENNSIRKIDPSGRVTTLLRKTDLLTALAVTPTGEVIYADTFGEHCAHVYSLSLSSVERLIAGKTDQCNSIRAEDGVGESAEIPRIDSLQVSSNGDIYANAGVLSSGGKVILRQERLIRIDPLTRQKSTIFRYDWSCSTVGVGMPGNQSTCPVKTYELGDFVLAGNSNQVVVVNNTSAVSILRGTPPDDFLAVAGGTVGSNLELGSLPGALTRLSGLVMDNEGSLYTTTQNAVIKIRLK